MLKKRIVKKYYMRSFMLLTNHYKEMQQKESTTYGEKDVNVQKLTSIPKNLRMWEDILSKAIA